MESSRAPPRYSSNQTGNPIVELIMQSTPYGVVVVRFVSVSYPSDLSSVASRFVLPAPDSPDTNNGGAGGFAPRSRDATTHPMMIAMVPGSFIVSRAISDCGSHGPGSSFSRVSSFGSPYAGGM